MSQVKKAQAERGEKAQVPIESLVETPATSDWENTGRVSEFVEDREKPGIYMLGPISQQKLPYALYRMQ